MATPARNESLRLVTEDEPAQEIGSRIQNTEQRLFNVAVYAGGQAVDLANTIEAPNPQHLFDLTDREAEILGMMRENGDRAKEISQQLWIEKETVRVHQKRIYRKMDVSSGLEAVAVVHKNSELAITKKAQALHAAAVLMRVAGNTLAVNPSVGIEQPTIIDENRWAKSLNNTKLGQEEIESLTKIEKDVLGLTCLGLNNKEIADKMILAEQTVKFHLTNIFKKMNVKNRTQAAFVAYGSGLLDWDADAKAALDERSSSEASAIMATEGLTELISRVSSQVKSRRSSRDGRVVRGRGLG